jgi:hypothetical protein
VFSGKNPNQAEKNPAFRAGIRRTLYKFVDMFTNLPPEPLQREVLRPFLRAFKA